MILTAYLSGLVAGAVVVMFVLPMVRAVRRIFEGGRQ